MQSIEIKGATVETITVTLDGKAREFAVRVLPVKDEHGTPSGTWECFVRPPDERGSSIIVTAPREAVVTAAVYFWWRRRQQQKETAKRTA
jgi:hypothetical protein